MKWSENAIARFLARHTFDRKHLVIVPNCSWPGSECDLLIVTPNLRLIDVEIKISRSDLRADFGKDKWFHNWDWHKDGPMPKDDAEHRRRRDWPARAWKHYYAAPTHVWGNGIPEDTPAASGCLSLDERDGSLCVRVLRQAKACRDAEKISAESAIDIARLASLRLWDAYAALERR